MLPLVGAAPSGDHIAYVPGDGRYAPAGRPNCPEIPGRFAVRSAPVPFVPGPATACALGVGGLPVGAAGTGVAAELRAYGLAGCARLGGAVFMTPSPYAGTILVVDDTSAVLTMIQAMLKRYGYTAISATGGRAAIDILQRENGLRFDLVLLDVVMKDMTGPETAREIRRLRPGLPIVFMTGFPEHSARLELQDEPVIRKPFSSVTLIPRIRAMIENPKVASAASE